MPDLLTDFVQYVRDELLSSIPVPIRALIVSFVLKYQLASIVVIRSWSMEFVLRIARSLS